MRARVRKLLTDLGDTFWLVPALMVLGGVLAAIGLVEVDRSDALPEWLLAGPWLYNGGGTGARTLLGAIASSTIGVAGTVFAITIAALSLAAGQMGPRLLRNFTRDRGNQFTLGAFLATFSYALMVLRSVRTQSEGEFIPHLSLSFGILLAFLCVATLVLFRRPHGQPHKRRYRHRSCERRSSISHLPSYVGCASSRSARAGLLGRGEARDRRSARLLAAVR